MVYSASLLFIHRISMKLICPECKNAVDLSSYGDLAAQQTIECDTCGINLLVTDISGDMVAVTIVDEGK